MRVLIATAALPLIACSAASEPPLKCPPLPSAEVNATIDFMSDGAGGGKVRLPSGREVEWQQRRGGVPRLVDRHSVAPCIVEATERALGRAFQIRSR